MKYLTVGTKELKADMLYGIEDLEDIGIIKPRGGLWLTKYYDDTPNYNEWVDYMIEHPSILCYKNKEPNIFVQQCALVTLKKDTKIFVLDTPEKHKYLIDNYPYNKAKFSYEDLSADYDGIYVRPHEITKNDNNETTREKFNRFSIDSLILFNLDCIDYYQSGIVDIEPFDVEFPEYDYCNRYYEIKIEATKKKVDTRKTEKNKKRVLVRNEKIIH